MDTSSSCERSFRNGAFENDLGVQFAVHVPSHGNRSESEFENENLLSIGDADDTVTVRREFGIGNFDFEIRTHSSFDPSGDVFRSAQVSKVHFHVYVRVVDVGKAVVAFEPLLSLNLNHALDCVTGTSIVVESESFKELSFEIDVSAAQIVSQALIERVEIVSNVQRIRVGGING